MMLSGPKTKPNLKPYVVYSRFSGPEEGSMLAFANNVQEARVVAWNHGGDLLTDEFIDLTARLLKDKDWLYFDGDFGKLRNDIPHAVLDPPACSVCGFWGNSPLGMSGVCEDCLNNLKREIPESGEYTWNP